MTSKSPPPPDFLRRVTVYVDEPDPGEFFWVLIESTEDATVWVDIESSEEFFPTWSEAIIAGGNRLAALAPNPAIGPRATGEDENASPVG